MQPCATSHPSWKEQNFPIVGRGKRNYHPSGQARRFMAIPLWIYSSWILYVCAHLPDAEVFSSLLPFSMICSGNTLCPTSLLSSVIHCQVINHQQYRKYLARQKCENTSTPNGNWTRRFPAWVTPRELQSDKNTELAIAKTPQTWSGFYVTFFSLYFEAWECKKSFAESVSHGGFRGGTFLLVCLSRLGSLPIANGLPSFTSCFWN